MTPGRGAVREGRFRVDASTDGASRDTGRLGTHRSTRGRRSRRLHGYIVVLTRSRGYSVLERCCNRILNIQCGRRDRKEELRMLIALMAAQFDEDASPRSDNENNVCALRGTCGGLAITRGGRRNSAPRFPLLQRASPWPHSWGLPS